LNRGFPPSSLVESHLDEKVSVREQSLDELPKGPDSDSLPAPFGMTLEEGSESLSNLKEIEVRKQPRLWAVGGGKGGVGKSLISANFSLLLARRGKRVIAIDLDLGGSNLHTCLGIEPPKLGVGDWASKRINTLEEAIVQTPEPGLRIISGSNDPVRITSLIEKRSPELIAALKKLDADEIVIDLGAGTHELTIDFFNAAEEGVLSILPEPTSVENAYRFIRAVFFRKLRSADVPHGIKEVIDASTDQKNILGIKTPADLLAIVDRLDETSSQKLREQIRLLKPSIVINQVRSQVDIDVGRAICSVCRRYFGIEVRYAGYIDYDNSVWRAVRSKRAVIEEYPHSVLANRIEHLTRALLGEDKGLFP
jgi:flagellar biosynthesis protein FlhG